MESFAKKDKQREKKVSIVMKRMVCRLVSKESWYMGYKGVCGIKIDLVLRLIQEKQQKKKKRPSSIMKNKPEVVVC